MIHLPPKLSIDSPLLMGGLHRDVARGQRNGTESCRPVATGRRLASGAMGQANGISDAVLEAQRRSCHVFLAVRQLMEDVPASCFAVSGDERSGFILRPCSVLAHDSAPVACLFCPGTPRSVTSGCRPETTFRRLSASQPRMLAKRRAVKPGGRVARVCAGKIAPAPSLHPSASSVHVRTPNLNFFCPCLTP